MPPELLTGTATKFDGDPEELLLVTPDSILQGYADNTFGEQDYLRNILGCQCPGVYKTKQEFLDDASLAFVEIASKSPVIPPCTWHRLYAPMAFSGDFSKTTGDDGGWSLWGLRGMNVWWREPHLFPGGEGHYQDWDPIPFQILYWGDRPHREFVGPDQIDIEPYVEVFNWVGPAPALTIVDTCMANHFTLCLPLVVYGTETIDKLAYERPDGQEGLYMPIPPIPDLGASDPPPLAVCGGFNLNAVTDVDAADIVVRGGGLRSIGDVAAAYAGDTVENQTTYAQVTQIPNSLNVPELEATIDAATDEQLNEIIDDLLNRDDPAVLQTVRQAYLKGSVEDKTNLLADFAIDTARFEILQQFSQAGSSTTLEEDLTRELLRRGVTGGVFDTAVEAAAEGEATSMFWRISPIGRVVLVLAIGAELLKGNTKVENLLARHCNGDEDLVVAVETARTALGAEVSNKAFMQLLLDKLDQLLECCNPCEEGVQAGETETFIGFQTTFGAPHRVSGDYPGIYRVQFNIIEDLFPKVFTFGEPELHLLAKFAWRDNLGRYGPIQYVNIENQEFIVSNDEQRGFMVHCYPGVVLLASIRFKQNWAYPPG